MKHGQTNHISTAKKIKQISDSMRHTIQTLHRKGYKVKEIASLLEFHRSTIYRELQRGRVEHVNSDLIPFVTYSADKAIIQAEENRSAKGPKLKIDSNQMICDTLRTLMIKLKYSPYAALEICRRKFKSQCDKVNIPCVKTIYNYIHKFGFPIIPDEMIHKRKKQKKKASSRRQGLKTREGMSIEKRPKSANTREELGHHEIDLVLGARGTKACLLVITERRTRFEHIIWMPDKTQQSVKKALNKLETHYGNNFKELFLSFTSDNGSEFLDPYIITTSRWGKGKSKRCQLYYAHPYCSSERGSNENANRLIRRFLPKGRTMEDIDQSVANSIARWMNLYPRKLFNGKSSASLAKQFTFHNNPI